MFPKFPERYILIKKVILHERISVCVRKLFYFRKYLPEDLENTIEENKEVFQLRLSKKITVSCIYR